MTANKGCASQNDVFALDDAGDVFRYNFSAKTWVRLIADRHPEEETASPRAAERP